MEQQSKAIHRTIAVLSGKGGVGKSTVAVNLAVGLSRQGFSTGLLDADIHGPSVPSLLHLETMKAYSTQQGIQPIFYEFLKIMSLGFMLQSMEDAVIWRGPMKMQAVKQMVEDVDWGELDYLIIDLPPGTGDEPLSICQLLPELSGCIVVTTPQYISAIDVRRSIAFCRKLNIPIIGLVENMNNIICPSCGKDIELYPSERAKNILSEMDVPFICSIPFHPEIAKSSDAGIPIIETDHPAASEFRTIIHLVKENLS